MSFLTWLFALGGLGIIFPILFHLIRPTPKGSQKFSSLMFLGESPPRISKRSRIDNWLLLLLRAAVIALLALAFMRPFFRTGGEIFVSDMPGNRVAVLVDTSASMRNGWGDVQEVLDNVLDQLETNDNVALFAFDDRFRSIVGFAEDNQKLDLESRKKLIRDQFSTLAPTWHRTDLGNALAATADAVSEVEESQRTETGLQIVLISDMQKGADLSGLQSYVWPEDVRVDVRAVVGDPKSNATIRMLPTADAVPLNETRRVRLTNAEFSNRDSFNISWGEGNDVDKDSQISLYAAPGTSHVFQMPLSKSIEADRLLVDGDAIEFDNQFFVTNQSQQKISIAYFGTDEPEDAQEYYYFLSRVIPDSRSQIVSLDYYSTTELADWKDGITPRMAVVTNAVSEEVQGQLEAFVKQGGTLLVVATDEATFTSVSDLLPAASVTRRDVTDRGGYALLGAIDFSHPLFAPLAGPQFNDFTSIQFWNYLPVQLDVPDDEDDRQATVVAAFDNDLAAIWQSRIGEGLVLGMATSWRPEDSQLARSTKFVPLITSLLRMTDRTQRTRENYLVGETIGLPESQDDWTVKTPSANSKVTIVDGQVSPFDMPGVFEFQNRNQQFKVAVNLHPHESLTSPVDASGIESYDVRLGTQPSSEEVAGSLQKRNDRQLENRQRIWKWLIVAAICILVLETLVAARQSSPNRNEVSPA